MKRLLAFVALLVTTGFPAGLLAVTFTVNTPFDAGDATPGDGACKISGPDLCTLRAAIQEANALAGEDEIDLPAGTYILTIVSTNEDNAVDGDLDIKANLTIHGAGSDVTIINANGGVTLDRAFHVLAPATSVVFEGVQIIGGDTANDGGGISSAAGVNLQLTDVIVRNNTAGSSGGGMVALGPLSLIRSSVLSNAAVNFGGGIASVGPLSITDGSAVSGNHAAAGSGVFSVSVTDTTTVTDSSIDDNVATADGSGLIVANTLHVENSSVSGNQSSTGQYVGIVSTAGDITISDSHVDDNAAADSSAGVYAANGNIDITSDAAVSTVNGNTAKGGAGVVNVSAGKTTSLTGVIIQQNVAGSSGGAGVLSFGNLTIDGCTVAENSAAAIYGGVALLGGASTTTTITHSTIRDNFAVTGAGVVMGDGTLALSDSTLSGNTAISNYSGLAKVNGTATVTNTTISGNNGGAAAGGILNQAGNLDIVNATVTGNTAVAAAGIGVGAGTVTFKNTIISANTGGNCVGPITSNGFNIEDTDTCGLTATGDQKNTDPKLRALADNGGLTQTHNLQPDSPAIDTGTDTGAPTTDQRGITRPLDGNADGTAAFDIGAVEFDRCGDGVTQTDLGEECDDANSVNTDACTNACKNAVCGDTFVQSGEQCDDGNTTAGDGCSATCTAEVSASVCGNGAIDGSEACDDGNTTDEDGCSSSCTVEKGFSCNGTPSVCVGSAGGCSLIRL